MTKLTHKGWIGLCPIYVGAIRSQAPEVEPRHWIFAPLLSVSLFCFECCFFIQGIFDEDFEPQWPLRITGEVKR